MQNEIVQLLILTDPATKTLYRTHSTNKSNQIYHTEPEPEDDAR